MSLTLLENSPTLSATAWFDELSANWRRMGVCLYLYDATVGQMTAARKPARFFDLLQRKMPGYQDYLSRIAADVLANGEPLVTDFSEMLRVVGVPYRRRRRVEGVVLGVVRTGSLLSDERWLSLCGGAGLDATFMAKQAQEVAEFGQRFLAGWQGVLEAMVQQAFDCQCLRGQFEELSEDLGATYEELSLLYRVAGSLKVTTSPESYFQSLCEQLVDVLDVETVVAVIQLPSQNQQCPAPEDPVKAIAVGRPLADEQEYLRLGQYVSVRLAQPEAAGSPLIATPEEGLELDWASSWLENVAGVTIQCTRSPRGVLMGINRRGDEFVSSNLKLLSGLSGQSAVFLDNVHLYEDMHHLMMGLLDALVSSIDAKDPYTCGHSQRVARLAKRLAESMGLPSEQCDRIYLSGLLHDVGKIGVRESVLLKPGRLTNEEYDKIKTHPETGARILRQVRQIQDVVPGVLHHHERVDGRGYPHGLAGRDIPLMGRIVGLADSFDAMTSPRTYRGALPMNLARAEIRRFAGTQFDPVLAEVFLRMDLPASTTETDRLGHRSLDITLTVP